MADFSKENLVDIAAIDIVRIIVGGGGICGGSQIGR